MGGTGDPEKRDLTQRVVDLCAGTGILTLAAEREGYEVLPCDIHYYGFDIYSMDYLSDNDDISKAVENATGFMNPPFSKAVQSVEKSFDMGARKIVCFQRFAWWESKGRRDFWQKYPPNRIYICSDRADCWRHDILADQRGSGSPTAHAWFV